eukprot:7385783-Prymnesium_polylepis.1
MAGGTKTGCPAPSAPPPHALKAAYSLSLPVMDDSAPYSTGAWEVVLCAGGGGAATARAATLGAGGGVAAGGT